MSWLKRTTVICINWLGSYKLALVLILLLILFSIAGATLPQEGDNSPLEISFWKEKHSLLSSIFSAFGLFHVFKSYLFLLLIFVLALNLIACTIVRLTKTGVKSAFSRKARIRTIGFLTVHLSLLGIFAGGITSGSLRFDGTIILTEGQIFQNEHKNYVYLSESSFLPDIHQPFMILQKAIEPVFEKKKLLPETKTTIEFKDSSLRTQEAIIRMNHPFEFDNLAITLQDVGFSPRLQIIDNQSGQELMNNFIALGSRQSGSFLLHYDFIDVPFLKNKIFITLYPAYKESEGKIISESEQPLNPVLMLERENDTGIMEKIGFVKLTEKIVMDNLTISFVELRRYNTLQLVIDPGFSIMVVSFCISLIGLIIRYIPDLSIWFKE